MSSHDQKVAAVAEQVKASAKLGKPVEFAKKSVSHLVPNPYQDPDAAPKIDLRPLTEILEIDEKNMTCTAESGVTFNDLAKATLAKGLVPYTVSELKGITIGGAVSGCSIESMSYKFGGFHDMALEYEAVTGTGEIITCSPDDNPDLFHGLHGSYGTLGIITKLKFKLVPAKKYVKLEYRLHTDFDTFWADTLERCEKGDYPFIDAIIHGPGKFVLVLGEMVDSAPYVSKYDWLEIFYKSTLKKREDYMEIKDYFFRYDAECHWLTKTFPPLEWKPVRFAIGKLILGSDNLIAWSNRLRHILRLKKRPEVVVDVFIPSRNFPEFYKWYEKDFDFFPLWIVPYKMPEIYPFVDPKYAKEVGETFVIDAAVYGKPNTDKNVDWSEVMEKKVHEMKGFKTLISRNHYAEDEFWSYYDKSAFAALKKRLDPGNLFGGLYERFAPSKYVK
jgi:FAD/FMN-containing dehydrogenase